MFLLIRDQYGDGNVQAAGVTSADDPEQSQFITEHRALHSGAQGPPEAANMDDVVDRYHAAFVLLRLK